MSKVPFHAFYSENMALWCGTYLYRRPDGTPIEVTATARTKEFGERYICWADLKYLGIVHAPSKRGKEATL